MKIRVASQQPVVNIGDSGLTGRTLVREDDLVGYTCFDVILEPGLNFTIQSIGSSFNHIYYCVYGKVVFECSEGTTETLKDDHLVALTGEMQAKIKAVEKTSLFITYVKEAEGGKNPSKAFYYTLDQILGTERDVDWFRGRSRRYLRQAEGFNVSLHNTVCYQDTSSALQYRNNKESAYLIEGHVQYIWDEGKSSYEFYQVDRKEGNGTCITYDKNDSHILNGKSLPSTAVCIFYPALKGTETHDFTKGASSY